MIKGGRWIATFDHAIRGFNIKEAKKSYKEQQKNDYDLVVYGGVRGSSGFLLSRLFSFLASPTYNVACVTIKIRKPSDIKWSSIVEWIREITTLKRIMEFEWLWILFYGEGNISKSLKDKIDRFTQRDIALLYADIRNKDIVFSDTFIGKRGGKLFHPKNLDRPSLKEKLKFRGK
jgi:hypothetical protein